MIHCSVLGVGVLGPGLPDWRQARSVLAGGQAWECVGLTRVVAPDLPRTEARRATLATHLALSVASQAMAGQDPPDDDMPSVWAAADSDLVGLEKNCRTLAEDPPWISPHRFQNSVHNTPSGYWSIATGCHGAATAVSSAGESFAAGLVEALVMLRAGHERCLLVACDEASPPTLTAVRPVPHSFATALLLGRDPAAGMPLRVDCRPAADESTASQCADAGLEALRAVSPAARALPLLGALAGAARRRVRLSWSSQWIDIEAGEAP